MADFNSLQLFLDGVTQSFSEWTAQFCRTYYPKVGQRCYRVPGLHFNEQKLTVSKGQEFSDLLLHPPDSSKARGDLAHTVVLESLEQLGQRMERAGGSAPFIISALNYDSYLQRVRPPPPGKENRPRQRKLATKVVATPRHGSNNNNDNKSPPVAALQDHDRPTTLSPDFGSKPPALQEEFSRSPGALQEDTIPPPEFSRSPGTLQEDASPPEFSRSPSKLQEDTIPPDLSRSPGALQEDTIPPPDFSRSPGTLQEDAIPPEFSRPPGTLQEDTIPPEFSRSPGALQEDTISPEFSSSDKDTASNDRHSKTKTATLQEDARLSSFTKDNKTPNIHHAETTTLQGSSSSKDETITAEVHHLKTVTSQRESSPSSCLRKDGNSSPRSHCETSILQEDSMAVFDPLNSNKTPQGASASHTEEYPGKNKEQNLSETPGAADTGTTETSTSRKAGKRKPHRSRKKKKKEAAGQKTQHVESRPHGVNVDNKDENDESSPTPVTVHSKSTPRHESDQEIGYDWKFNKGTDIGSFRTETATQLNRSVSGQQQHCSGMSAKPATEERQSVPQEPEGRNQNPGQYDKAHGYIRHTDRPTFENLDRGGNTGANPPSSSSPPLRSKPPTPLLPPRPRDMSEKGQRGELDVVVLHRQCGVVLIEVKSIGMVHPSYRYNEKDILDTVLKAVSQLKRGRDVFRFIMADMAHHLGITLIVALPCVSRELLTRVLGKEFQDPDIQFLCHDDLTNAPYAPQSDESLPQDSCDVNETSQSVMTSTLMTWWARTVYPHAVPMPLEHMRCIVGRVCGLLSIVSVWTRTRPRVEVRTPGQAVSEAGDRFSDIVLLPEQAHLLAQPSLTRLCLTGPMGSGKTLLLQLKGRQWRKEGRRVVVLNTRRLGRGRPAGHVLAEAISRGDPGGEGCGTVERIDLAFKKFDLSLFRVELEKGGPTDRLGFILDEVTHFAYPMVEELIQAFPQCLFWCVAMFVRQLPAGFNSYRLGAVLRCPPSVQLLLRELDLNPLHAGVYSTRSAARGLPCDGPPVMLIQHENHDTSLRLHDCVQCADELAEVIRNTLGLQKRPGPQCPQESVAQPTSSTKTVKTVEAKPLSFKDVLLLFCAPMCYYQMKADDKVWKANYSYFYPFWLYVKSCPFVERLRSKEIPLEVIIDNTSRDIALPADDIMIGTDVMGVQSLERKLVIYVPGVAMLEREEEETGSKPSLPAHHNQTEPPPPSQQQTSDHPGLPQSQITDDNIPKLSEPTSVPASMTPGDQKAEDALTSSRMNRTSELPSQTQQKLPHSHVSDNEPSEPAPDAVSRQTGEKRPGSSSTLQAVNKMRKCSPSRASDGSHATSSSMGHTDQQTYTGCEDEDKSSRPVIASAQRSSSDQDWSNIRTLMGNMIVDDEGKPGPVSASQRPQTRCSSVVRDSKANQSDTPHRLGMDIRGDSPFLLSALQDAREARASSHDSSRDSSHDERNNFFTAVSSFPLLDDVDAGRAGHVLEEHRHRLRHAVSAMSMDEQDWLFMAAARCLSQLVVIVPAAARQA